MLQIALIFNLTYADSQSPIFSSNLTLLPPNSTIFLLTKFTDETELAHFQSNFTSPIILPQTDLQLSNLANFSHFVLFQPYQQITTLHPLFEIEQNHCYRTANFDVIFTPNRLSPRTNLSKANFLGCQTSLIENLTTFTISHPSQIVQKTLPLPPKLHFLATKKLLEIAKIDYRNCEFIEFLKQILASSGVEPMGLIGENVEKYVRKCGDYLQLKMANPMMYKSCYLSVGDEIFVSQGSEIVECFGGIRGAFAGFKRDGCNLAYAIIADRKEEEVESLVLFYAYLMNIKVVKINGVE